jgi:hypothetical protein
MIAPVYGQLLSPHFRTQLKFSDYRLVISDATTGYEFGPSPAINLNSVYQPMSSTHQPYGYDQITPLYRRYKVNSARVRVEFLSPGAPLVAAVLQRPEGAVLTLDGATISSVAELPRCWVMSMTNIGGHAKAVFERNINMADACGVTQQQYDADIEDYGAFVNASPNRVPTIQFGVGSATTSTGIYVLTTVIYDVTFYDMVFQSQS